MASTHTFPTLAAYRAMLGPTFTLAAFQAAVQFNSTKQVHKASFRRILRQHGVVASTGRLVTTGRGRPGALYRFAKVPKAHADRVAYLLAQWGY